MSKCISRHGEYSEHELDAEYTCKLCLALDEDAFVKVLRRLRMIESMIGRELNGLRFVRVEQDPGSMPWNRVKAGFAAMGIAGPYDNLTSLVIEDGSIAITRVRETGSDLVSTTTTIIPIEVAP